MSAVERRQILSDLIEARAELRAALCQVLPTDDELLVAHTERAEARLTKAIAALRLMDTPTTARKDAAGRFIVPLLALALM